jgi:hypothetical protein
MVRKSRLQIAKQDIIRHFEKLSEKVFRQTDIAAQLALQRRDWKFTQTQTLSDFILFLLKTGRLWKAEFPFPEPYKKETRYVWGKIPMYEVMLALKPKSYFSHYTAVRLHGLTEQVPKTTYINFEQPSQSIPTGKLSQGNIDSAFKHRPRISSYIADVGDFRVCILNGKNTDNLGVVEEKMRLDSELMGKIRLTNIERTLIDIAVRPVYAGGVGEVLKAYKLAHGKASVNRLVANLKGVAHIYPYHQAIGFYLERAGYKPSMLELLRELPMEFDFYLAHQMGETDYVKNWRLHIPKGF